MTRQTSIEAFKKIKDDGLLSKRRFQVYSYVFENGPCTAREATKSMMRQGLNSGSISTRFSELERIGVFKEVGTKKDQETGQTVILWDVTENLPVKFDKIVKIKCEHCSGKGYFIEQQTKLF